MSFRRDETGSPATREGAIERPKYCVLPSGKIYTLSLVYSLDLPSCLWFSVTHNV